MDIQIQNQQSAQKIQTSLLEQILERALRHLACEGQEVSVLLVDDQQIQKLNRQYRHKDYPTDVLAFCQQDSRGRPPSLPKSRRRVDRDVRPYLLGDIVISIPTAQRQAEEMGHSLKQELKILLIHGLLHLLGYDHIQDDEAAVMQEKEAELLARVL